MVVASKVIANPLLDYLATLAVQHSFMTHFRGTSCFVVVNLLALYDTVAVFANYPVGVGLINLVLGPTFAVEGLLLVILMNNKLAFIQHPSIWSPVIELAHHFFSSIKHTSRPVSKKRVVFEWVASKHALHHAIHALVHAFVHLVHVLEHVTSKVIVDALDWLVENRGTSS